MAESATVLLFLSKGYFKSLNCLREVKAFTAAKREDQGLILVHETAPTHGGVTLEHLRQECPADLAPQIFSDTNLQKLIPFYRQVRDGWPCNPRPLWSTPPTPLHLTHPPTAAAGACVGAEPATDRRDHGHAHGTRTAARADRRQAAQANTIEADLEARQPCLAYRQESPTGFVTSPTSPTIPTVISGQDDGSPPNQAIQPLQPIPIYGSVDADGP